MFTKKNSHSMAKMSKDLLKDFSSRSSFKDAQAVSEIPRVSVLQQMISK